MAEIVKMPKLGFDMAEGTLVRWVVGEGENVERGTVLAEIETDKATVEVESSHTGVVKRHLVHEGTAVPVGEPIAVIGASDEEVDVAALLSEEKALVEAAPVAEQEVTRAAEVAVEEKEKIPAEEVEGVPEEAHLPEGVPASPLARRIAQERGVDLKKIDGTGPGGRIVKADVETYLEEMAKVVERVPKMAPPVAPAVVGLPRKDRPLPLSRLRAIIGRRMVESMQQAPHFFVTHEYDMASLTALRNQVNALLPEEEKFSFNDFIIKAVALALREFPNLNATLVKDKNEVLQFGHINIGVAVAVENGLLTVVCRDADLKSVRQIAADLKQMVARARTGKVRPEDIEGSTFSVSNMGMFDVENFTAIINPPEAAILAVSSVKEVPVVEDGELKPGLRMKATISIDHRVSDGAEAARFMQALEKYLEEPLRLMV